MTADSLALTPETLAQHEPFLRAVVRGLLRDENQLQDAVQETWLRALGRRPRSETTTRGWLRTVATNVVRDARRGAARRGVRERAAARAEAIESTAETVERLATQREVVGAVLALREPYRTVVLLRFYHDLAPAQIAERVDRSAATVRSQLARAQAILRDELDRRVEGGRKTWMLLATPTRSATTLGVPALLAGVGVASLVGFTTWSVLTTPSPPRATDSLVAAQGVAAAVETLIEPAEIAPPVDVRSRTSIAPQQDGKPGDASRAAKRAKLGRLDVHGLLDLAVQSQRAIRDKLLTPDKKWLKENAALLELPNTGVCRLVSGREDTIPLRGGGSYYSFATLSHSYDDEPDISYGQGALGSGFYGGSTGFFLELGDVPLAELSSSQTRPTWLPEERAKGWDVLWSPITQDMLRDSEFRSSTRELTGGRRTQVGRTYLLRSVMDREHDHLVALRVLERSDDAVTLAWRILHAWPMADARSGNGPREGEYPDVPDGPKWLEDLSVDQLTDLLRRIREHAQPKLFEVPKDLAKRYAKATKTSEDSFAVTGGIARILHRGAWLPIVEQRGGGAYYSFLERDNEYNGYAELELQQDRYSSGFAGSDKGYLLDLGPLPFESLRTVLKDGPPEDLTERQLEAWDFLWTVRATVDDNGRRKLSDADRSRAGKLGVDRGVPALLGNTYVLRAARFDNHDHLVVFTVIGADEIGHTIAWRILKSWAVER
ncbi:MAG: RNA polymerase sigma factor [bacterium]|nr:RNA polymerase sigma factor [bacterium]